MANQTRNNGLDSWIPPRGIRIFTTKRAKPFCVQWRELDSKRVRTKSFSSAAKQLAFAKRLADSIQAHGTDLLLFDPAKWKRFIELENTIGGFHNIPLVEKLWRDNGRLTAGRHLEEVLNDFLLSKERQNVCRDAYKRYLKMAERLNRSFPAFRVTELDAGLLTAWIDDTRKPNGRPVSPITKNNRRRELNTFFNFCFRRRFISVNPITQVDRWGIREKPVAIISPAAGRRLFTANLSAPAVGRLALEAFAGLRFSSAKRIQKVNINFSDHGIELPAANIKTAKRFYVDGFPPNLWQWLKHAPAECWTMTERQYQEEKKYCFIRADIEHPHNCLRHSFATYHVAAFGNVGKTATLLCHTNLSTLNRFYRGVATQAAGLDWFSICPQS